MGLILNKSSFSAFQNIFLISLLACIYILCAPFLRRKLNGLQEIHWNKDLVIFFLASGFSGVIWLKSLTIVPIGQATFLYSSAPFFVFFLESLFLKEKLSLARLITLIIGFIGVGLILAYNFSFSQNSIVIGSISVLTAAFLTAIQAVFNKKISKYYSLTMIIFIIMLSQAILSLPLALSSNWHVNVFSFATTVFLSIFSSLAAFYLYIEGFRIFKASSIVLAGYTEPFFASVWGLLFLSQRISFATLLGGVIILSSAYFMIKLEK